jgi:hypothetical protein
MGVRSFLHRFWHGPGDGRSRFDTVSRTYADVGTITVTSDEPFTIWEGQAMLSKAYEEAVAKLPERR